MIRSELAHKVAEANPDLYLRDAEMIVDAVLETIAEALVRGDRVEIRGFGSFSLKHHDARPGRNPRTGAMVKVAARAAVQFRTGLEMARRLNALE